MVLICWFNLKVEGNQTAVSALFGEVCVLIAALFVGVVMRLRFLYAASCISAMLIGGLWCMGHANGISPSENVIGSSLMLIGVGLIIVASYSLEIEERKSYLADAIRLQLSAFQGVDHRHQLKHIGQHFGRIKIIIHEFIKFLQEFSNFFIQGLISSLFRPVNR